MKSLLALALYAAFALSACTGPSSASAESRGTDIRQLIRTNSSDGARIAVALSLARQGQNDQALTLLNAAERIPDSSQDINYRLAMAQILEKLDRAQAWRTYRSLMEQYPKNPKIILRAGLSPIVRGEQTEELLLRQSWMLSPTPEAGLRLAKICLDHRTREEAQKFLLETLLLEGSEGHWRQEAERILLDLLKGPKKSGASYW